jgi:nucleoside-diphosphate-sugar epimerase
MSAPHCRFCSAALHTTFVDLGMSPLCETFIPADQVNRMEPFYPLHLWVCDQCYLVQIQEYVSAESIYGEYAYFSSYSDSYVGHARQFAEMALDRFELHPDSSVIEIASNDGYLLQHFVARGIPVLGIEPAANVAEAAVRKNIPTLVRFFGQETAREVALTKKADLLVGNNVLAHVPDINDFVAGLKLLLASHGVISMEFQHLRRMVEGNQFDTIYHEHFSYLSFLVVEKIFAAHGLRVFDVEEVGTHGGSLRVFACHEQAAAARPRSLEVERVRREELELGYGRLETYSGFGVRVEATKRSILEFLIKAKRAGKRIAAYGAPGKGNTLLNYCGIRTDMIDYAVDRNPYKHGKVLPGSHIPVFAPDRLAETRPDYIVIMPWNLKAEIVAQLAAVFRMWRSSSPAFGRRRWWQLPAPTTLEYKKEERKQVLIMKILVTGGAGFIGSHIVEAYRKAGHDVCVVDDLSTGYRHNVPDGVRFYQVDIRTPELARVFQAEQPDVVNHQAARANVRESLDKPLLYADVNVLGSLNVLECCRRYETKKIIYASTGGAVYGEPRFIPVTEDHPIDPLDPYGASKHHVEHYLKLYHHNFGIKYTALRYPNVYGPRQDPHGEAGVVAIFAGRMLQGGEPVINGSGEQQRDFVHVSDVARASVLALTRGDNEILNIGSGVGTDVNTIFRTLAELTSFPGKARTAPAKAGEVSRIFLDSKLAQERLGWQPTLSLTEGLASTVEYFATISQPQQV